MIHLSEKKSSDIHMEAVNRIDDWAGVIWEQCHDMLS